MKKVLITFLLCALTAFQGVFAYDRIPDDPETVIGKLSNGMTYYIRHNPNPEGCADFYIVHNVGALQEEDNQNGLAHFLEHMAFNGTKHYPDKAMLDFLAKEGVRFGYNVNAYTSRTETVYNISAVPLVRESFVDSVLTVLHDWSCDISCEQQALDDERGVISEEWRRRDDSRMRMAMKQDALIYKGSKHTERSVIGTLEVINGFKRHEILDFYHKWYRPDMQAVIIAGDIDPVAMEAKVKEMFSDIPLQENPAQKEIYAVPAMNEPLFENMTDPEIRYYTLKVMHRQPFPSKEECGTAYCVRDLLARQIVTAVAEERFANAAKEQGSPVKSAVLVTNRVYADFYNSMFTLSPKSENLLEETLAFYTREMHRLLEYGISEDEFEAAKLKVYKKNHLNQDASVRELSNKEIVNVCKENFLRGMPCIMPDRLQEIYREELSSITWAEASEYLLKMFRDSEKIYSYSINDAKAGLLPTPERMKEIIARVEAEPVSPAFISYEKLDISVDAAPGKIVRLSGAKRTGSGTEYEKWTLSNGATMYYIPSEPVKSDTRVAMTLEFASGYPALPADRLKAARAAASYMDRYAGFRNYERNSVRNSPEYLGVGIMSEIGRKSSTVTVLADSAHAENAFKMAWLTLSMPYFSDEKTLERFKTDMVSVIRNGESDARLFARAQKKAKYGAHPYLAEVDSTDIYSIDMDFVKEVWNRSFGDFSNMTVYLSSDLDRDAVRSLVEKYVASLGGDYGYAKEKYRPVLPVYGKRQEFTGTYPVKTVPKSDVNCEFRYKLKDTPKNRIALEVLDYIMSDRYIKQIREARGGTYHVSFSTSLSSSDNFCTSVVEFKTRPEMLDVLLGDVSAELDGMCASGPGQDEMDAAVKYLTKYRRIKESARKNSLRRRVDECTEYVKYGTSDSRDYEKTLSGITPGYIRKLARKVNRGNEFISVYTENEDE